MPCTPARHLPKILLLLSLLTLHTLASNPNLTCNGTQRPNSALISHTDAVAAIDQYCNQDFSLDPNFQETRAFYQTPPDGVSYDYYYPPSVPGYVVEMRATFADEEGCGGKRKFRTRGEECRRALGEVVEGCK